ATGDLDYNIAGGPTASMVTTTPGQQGSASQVDQLTIGADGGTFKIQINIGNGNGPETTQDIKFNDASDLKTKLEALDGMSGKVQVTGDGSTVTPFVITLDASLGNPNILVDGRKLTQSNSLQDALENLQSIHDFISQAAPKFAPLGGHVSVAKL